MSDKGDTMLSNQQIEESVSNIKRRGGYFMNDDTDLPSALGNQAKEANRLHAAVNSAEIESFLLAVRLEAVHQVERWGTAHDRGKEPADWFWLVGYLAGKAIASHIAGNREKALHHCISTAAALYNWHCAIKGTDVRMCPGKSDLEERIEESFSGMVEASHK